MQCCCVTDRLMLGQTLLVKVIVHVFVCRALAATCCFLTLELHIKDKKKKLAKFRTNKEQK